MNVGAALVREVELEGNAATKYHIAWNVVPACRLLPENFLLVLVLI